MTQNPESIKDKLNHVKKILCTENERKECQTEVNICKLYHSKE